MAAHTFRAAFFFFSKPASELNMTAIAKRFIQRPERTIEIPNTNES
jgi:hypothetical protein